MISLVDPIVRCINEIHVGAQNRQQFREFFPEETENEGEFLRHCNMR